VRVACLAIVAVLAVPSVATAGLHAASVAQKAKVIRGTGARVVNVSLPRSAPLVVTGRNSGSSNFIVHLASRSGGATEYLINEIGPWAGQVAWANAEAGRYRLVVDAEGPWTIALNQPTPSARKATLVPGAVAGRGSKVVQIRSLRELQPVVTGRHRGDANFIVHLIGIGGLTGEIYVFNEIGNYSGQTLIDEMPAGAYLLAVVADGGWSVRFAD
jgi:hypothetical protein